MKKITLLLLVFCFTFSFNSNAQQKQAGKKSIKNANTTLQLSPVNQRHFDETGFVRCITDEVHALRMQNDPSIESQDEFENWLAPLVQQRKAQMLQDIENGTFKMAVVNVPIIFHVITGSAGDTNDISAALIQAQIDQLNIDFNNLAGSTHAAAASAEINFIPAQVDPNGVPLAEPGIDRVYGYNGAQSQASMDGGIKQATIWDRSQYANIWVANLSNGILGYAQFPSNSTLPGMPANGGSAATDGVVVTSGSVGSVATPGTAAPYNLGRTLTHEIGHWIGLRHIWGDASCGDDFCADTPQSSGANFGCATNQTTCDGIVDMVENFMDYSDDACMDIFTFDQVARILTVLTNADGISDLPNSTTGNTSPTIAFQTTAVTEVEGSSCVSRDIDVPLVIGMGASADATVTFTTSGTATDMVDYQIVTPSVTFPQGSTASQILTIRIFEDDFIEGDETVVVNMTLNANGGDAALATGGAGTFTLTITDDDVAPNAGGPVTLINDDFESYNDFIITGIGDWLTIDEDGLSTYTGGGGTAWPNSNAVMAYQIFNPSAAGVTNATTGTEIRDFDPRSGVKYAASWAGAPSGGVTANDDWLVSPVLSLGASSNVVSFWVKAMSNSYGPENYNVGIYVGNGTPTSGADFTIISAATETAPFGTWTEDTFDLSALGYNNQDVRIGIHYFSSDAYMFMVDDFSATTFGQDDIQTAVNPTSSSQILVNGMGTAYATDSASGNVMASLQNNDTFNYGCTDISVSRAGTNAQIFQNPAPEEFVMDKVFTVTTDNSNTAGDVTATFYFTEAEIAGWEAATGKTRAELYILREASGVVEDNVAATVGAFGSNVTLSATFTSADGEFYFGPMNAMLSVNDVSFESFSMYPNPTNGALSISLNTTEDVNVALYDIRGREVYTKTFKSHAGVFAETINIDAMASGMYLIQIESGSKTVTKKLIKK